VRLPLLSFALYLLPVTAICAAPPTPKPHPRLLLEPGWHEHIRDIRAARPELDALQTALHTEAERLLDAPPIAYKLEGRRLLSATREALRRILLLAHVHLLTGDDRFLAGAEREMLQLARVPDWNPSHFLDTTEAAAALAIGYDWLHDKLAPETRTTIRSALVEKALRPALDPARKAETWFWTRDNNWNQVCIGGLVLAALAIAEDEPALCAEILERGREGIRHSQPPYAPDGIYPEGPSYWDYGTSYQVLLMAALRTALGTDWDLTRSPGFLESGDFMLHVTGPGGSMFNFADGGDGRGVHPALFWMARERNRPDLLQLEWGWFPQIAAAEGTGRKRPINNRFLPLLLHWSPDAKALRSVTAPRALSWVGHGIQPTAMHRTGWGANAVWVGFKGGRGSVNHAHIDAGSFVLEAGGVRWAVDLGMQDYNSLESKGIALWGRGQDAQRWTVFRLNNRAHNTLTVSDQLHVVDADAPILAHSADDPADRFTTVDLTRTLGGNLTRAHRTLRLQSGGAVRVEDALEGLAPGDSVRWAMHTRAAIAPEGSKATLAQDGKQLIATIVEPAGATFQAAPLPEPTDGFNAPNPGVSRLWIDLPAPTGGGPLRIVVRLQQPAP
jgi:hypothetical protein